MSQNELDSLYPEKPKHDSIPTTNAVNPQAEVFTIPREAFSYFIVAVAFFMLGGVGGFLMARANQQENAQLIQAAVNAAVEARGLETVQADTTPQIISVSADDDPSIGPADAPVTVIEFSDFGCGFCSRFAINTLPSLLEQYEGRIRYVYRDFPVPIAPLSFEAAMAGECADDQGAFWEMHELLFINQQAFSREAFVNFAQQLELDVSRFATCYDSQQHRGEVTADYSEAANLGIGGTPAFFVNGRFISGAQPLHVFSAAIDQALAAAQQS
jgi:protein-disulfide isomerase